MPTNCEFCIAKTKTKKKTKNTVTIKQNYFLIESVLNETIWIIITLILKLD